MSESKMLNNSEFIARHIGPDVAEQEEMLTALGYTDMDSFINDVIPASIHLDNPLALHDALGEPLNEAAALAQLR